MQALFVCVYIYIYILYVHKITIYIYIYMHVIYTLVSYFSLYKMFEHYKRAEYVYY